MYDNIYLLYLFSRLLETNTLQSDLVKQIACCNRILLNKSDLVNSTTTVEAMIRGLNPEADLLITNFCSASLKELLRFESTYTVPDVSPGPPHSWARSILLKTSKVQSLRRLNAEIGRLLWDSNFGPRIYRFKGLILTRVDMEEYQREGEVEAWCSLQGVGDAFEWHVVENGIVPATAESRLLFVGEELDDSQLDIFD